ncbi:MAG: hypothetical protein WBG95_17335 [Sulfitobacter sp.]
MASSKKPGPARSKSTKSKAVGPKIEDAVIAEDQNASDAAANAKVLSADQVTVEDVVSVETDIPKGPSKKTDDKVQSSEPAAVETASMGTPDDAPKSTDEETKAHTENTRPTPVPETKTGNSFLPLVLGGIVAGVIGFIAAQSDMFSADDAGITTQLRSDLNTQQERIAALESVEPAVAPAAEAPTVDLSPLEAEIAALEERLTVLENRPATPAPEGVDPDAAAAYAAELDELKNSVETQRGEIEALLNNARSVEEATAESARSASAQAAISKIVSAIDAGRPFEDALFDLEALDITIDPALSEVAANGVSTLSALQAEFPDRARSALAAARASGTGEGEQGIGGFLSRSLGVRSVAPREGADPDAVLSRAEAKIRSGDLATTLNELDTLPEEAQAAITEWRAAADARMSARDAADALAQRLTAD